MLINIAYLFRDDNNIDKNYSYFEQEAALARKAETR
jgi:hypothetical protein